MTIKLADVNLEYKKNPELKNDDVKTLLEWADKQPHLPKVTEFDVILFLQSCYYSSEKAKTALDNYYTMHTLVPDFFQNRNASDPEFRGTLESTLMATLPTTTPEGYTVFISRLMDPNPNLYIYHQQVKLFDMTMSLELHQHGTMKGMLILVDMTGGTFAHLTKASVSNVKKALYYVQEALPVRLVGVHFINQVPFMDKVMMLIKPFMKKELANLIHIHTKLDSLYEFIPQEMLPKDYGGQNDSLVELHEHAKKMLVDGREILKREETMLVDASKRPANSVSEASSMVGVPGTFKKIDID